MAFSWSSTYTVVSLIFIVISCGQSELVVEISRHVLDHELGERVGLGDDLDIADRGAGEAEHHDAHDLAARREREGDAAVDQDRSNVLGRALERDRATGPLACA